MDDDAFVRHVGARLAGLPGVEAVTLGGSRAEGTSRPDSDWDFSLYWARCTPRPRGVDLPRPGAVAGDQLPTDGILAYRLGYTFLHYMPELVGVPLGPALMHRWGKLVRPVLFGRPSVK